MEIYSVGGFTFDNETEAKRAKQELQLIENLKNKTNINSPVIAKQLLDRCKATGTFKTKVGTEFLNKLKQTADSSTNNKVNDKNSDEILSVSNNENTKNYADNKTNDKYTEKTSFVSNEVYAKNYTNNNINDNTRKILKQCKNYSPPLASGSLWSKIFIFVLPLLAIGILQQLFNYADYSYFVHLGKTTFLAYKGGYHSFISLIVTLFIGGLSIGVNATISYYIGKNNIEKIKKAVHTSILLVIIISIIVTFIGLIFSNQIAEILFKDFKSSGSFFSICFLSIPFQAFYYCGATIMFSKGDTKRPLICILISGVINVFFSKVFVEDLEMELYGVSFAILISQIISAGLMTYFLVNEKGILKLNLRNFSLDKKILINVDKEVLSKILKISIPIVLQNIVLWISEIYIVKGEYLPITNSDLKYYSRSIEYIYPMQQIEIFANVAISAFSITSVTFISQNYGANKFERCSKIIKYCLMLGGLFTILLSILFFVFQNLLPVTAIIFIILFEIFNLATAVFSSSMYGYGYSFIPAVISVFAIYGIKLLLIYPIYQNNPTFETLLAVYSISWIITAIAIILAYFVVKRRIKSKAIN